MFSISKILAIGFEHELSSLEAIGLPTVPQAIVILTITANSFPPFGKTKPS